MVDAAEKALLAVRAVTSFIVLPRDRAQWPGILAEATQFNAAVSAGITSAGYAVQTLRIITNPFGEYLDTASVDTALAGVRELQALLVPLEQKAGARIRFSIGAARDARELALVPALIQAAGDLANCCVNVPADGWGAPDAALCMAAAEACAELARCTPRGEGNFNFTVNFNGPELCPYFPAGFNTRESGVSFVVGVEYPNLLVATLKQVARARHGGEAKSVVGSPATRAADWAAAATAMRAAIERHVGPIAAVCREHAAASGRRFAGVDSSPAPSQSVASMAEVVRLLGVPHFGAAGTIEAAALLTRVFKSIEVGAPLCGFSGFMLACLEDKGLAAAAAKQQYDIRALLVYSAVCGIGLDTVPVPGDTPVAKMAALMCDTGTLAFRLSKPLTVRLFPVPGKAAGDVTEFASSDLCNCTVFAVP